MEPYISQPKLQKVKKIHVEKITYTSGNRNRKKFLIVSQKNLSLYFTKVELLKFRKQNFIALNNILMKKYVFKLMSTYLTD